MLTHLWHNEAKKKTPGLSYTLCNDGQQTRSLKPCVAVCCNVSRAQQTDQMSVFAAIWRQWSMVHITRHTTFGTRAIYQTAHHVWTALEPTHRKWMCALRQLVIFTSHFCQTTTTGVHKVRPTRSRSVPYTTTCAWWTYAKRSWW